MVRGNGRHSVSLARARRNQSPALSPDAKNCSSASRLVQPRELSNIDVSSGVAPRVTLPEGPCSYGRVRYLVVRTEKDFVYSRLRGRTAHSAARGQRYRSANGAVGAPARFQKIGPAMGLARLQRHSRENRLGLWGVQCGGAQAQTHCRGASEPGAGAFFADGRWLAYASDERGEWEVYVRPFPDGQGSGRSPRGGSQPLWRGDSKELFYVAADGQLIAVPIRGHRRRSKSGVSQPLFATRIPPLLAPLRTNYAVSSDGQRFSSTASCRRRRQRHHDRGELAGEVTEVSRTARRTDSLRLMPARPFGSGACDCAFRADPAILTTTPLLSRRVFPPARPRIESPCGVYRELSVACPPQSRWSLNLTRLSNTIR